MKKLFLTVVSAFLLITSFSQVQRRGEKTNTTDTARKGKTSTVPISTMSNTMNVTTNPSLNNAATTVNNTNNNTNNNNQPMTLEELTKKVESLPASLDALNERIPFENMAYVTVVADASNLEGASAQYPDRYKSMRIDNPLCNGNPKAKIFATREVNGRFDIFRITYNSQDGYWHLFPSTVSNITMSPKEIEYFKNGYNQDATVIKDYDNFEDFVKKGSFLWAYPTILRTGDAVQLLIFTDLPKYNPAIYQRPANQ
jgi:hypothetical protein